MISIGELSVGGGAQKRTICLFQVPSSCVYYLGLIRPNQAENDEKVSANLARFTPRELHQFEYCTTLLAERLLKLLSFLVFLFQNIKNSVLGSRIHKA